MSAGEAVARAAAGLVGCRFRLHGRDPGTGLDCVGLVGAALAAACGPIALPTGYRLRPGTPGDPAGLADAAGYVPVPLSAPVAPGEVWLLRPGPGQWHLGVVAPQGDGLVEAHAGLRRIVLTPFAAQRPRPPVLTARWAPAASCRAP